MRTRRKAENDGCSETTEENNRPALERVVGNFLDEEGKGEGIIIKTACDKASTMFKVMTVVLDVFVWDLKKVVKRGECCKGIKKE